MTDYDSIKHLQDFYHSDNKSSIQWFPGHMNKARNEIKELLPTVDVIIEMIDARIPYSSSNPMIAELQGNKPVIKVLNKADLADPEVTKQWIATFEKTEKMTAIACDTNKKDAIKQIIKLCEQYASKKVGTGLLIRTLIMGIPNVGKSSLINSLAGRTVTKTGDEPAVTKTQQIIQITNDIMLYDTPGMLWPKIENPNSGIRLAATGGIKHTAFDFLDVASHTLEYLIHTYPELLKQRFKIETLPQTDWEFIELAGKKRGFLKKGGKVDTERMYSVLINELRSSQIGRVSLETPTMKEAEEVYVQKLRDLAEAKKQEKLEKKRLRKLNARKNRG